MLVRQLAQAANEFLAAGTDTALALDRLDEEASRLLAHQRFGVVQIVELGILEAIRAAA